jgi:hypothetical protein
VESTTRAGLWCYRRHVSRLSTYRALGAPGGDFPDWVRALRGRSGVYAIRDRQSGAVLYVGESHTDRLYETMTRHVQRWGLEEAHTYQRGRVEVAVRLSDASEAQELQRAYICELQPRDNIYDTCEAVPF